MTLQEKRLCGKALLSQILSRLSVAKAKAVDGDFRPSKVVPMPRLGVPISDLFDQFMDVISPEKKEFILANYKTIIAKGRMISELEAKELYDYYANGKGEVENGKDKQTARKLTATSKTK